MNVKDTILYVSTPVDRSIPRAIHKPVRSSWKYQLRAKGRNGKVVVNESKAQTVKGCDCYSNLTKGGNS